MVGFQENAPELELTVAPGAAPAPRLKVNVCAGMSVSFALAVKVKVWPSVISLLAMGVSEGAVFGRKFAVRGVGVVID